MTQAPDPTPSTGFSLNVEAIVGSFREEVVDAFNVADGARTLSYAEYLATPAPTRGNDEADVVDAAFTTSLLIWLGWLKQDWRYNRSEKTPASVQRPDFRVISGGTTAFVVEDKSTAESWDAHSANQLRRYTTGTSGLSLWTNGRTLRMSRFTSKGDEDLLAICSVEALFGSAALLPFMADDGGALAQMYVTLCKARFTEYPQLVESACTTRADRIVLDEEQSLREFIMGIQAKLARLGLAAEAQIRAALRETNDVRATCDTLVARYERETLASLAAGPMAPELEAIIQDVGAHLGSLRPGEVDSTRMGRLIPDALRWSRMVLAIDAEYRDTLVRARGNLEIERLFRTWERQHTLGSDSDPVVAYSQQVAYVLFVRLLLVRILEDKNILAEPVVSNGGLDAWRTLIQARLPHSIAGAIQGHVLIELLFRTIGRFYAHFFAQTVFDWFEPDDYDLVLLLEHLNRYDFSDVSHDILGLTYEEYVTRSERNRRGHFLTRSPLVDYMLKSAGFTGRGIIDRRLLDPACGSGSFLIHGVRALRAALAEAMAPGATGAGGMSVEQRIDFARALLDAVGKQFVGMDIDPFACYLAELNLLVQILDEVALLWDQSQEAPLERLLIFNTDSLALPDRVLVGEGLELRSVGEEYLDEAAYLKARDGEFRHGFDFVVFNPP